MYWLKSAFEKGLWNSRMVVLFDLLYVAATIALIGLALYLTRGSESEKKPEPTQRDESQDSQDSH